MTTTGGDFVSSSSTSEGVKLMFGYPGDRISGAFGDAGGTHLLVESVRHVLSVTLSGDKSRSHA